MIFINEVSKKRKYGGIIQRLSAKFDIPPETVPNVPAVYITVCGKMFVNISCVKCVIEYRSDFLKVKAGKIYISVYGDGIVMKKRRDGSVDIEGDIDRTELS